MDSFYFKRKFIISKFSIQKVNLKILLSIIVLFLLYFSFLMYQCFIADDYFLISLYNHKNLFTLPDTHFFRPYFLYSYFINYIISGYNPAGYYFFNLSLHLLTSILVYHFLKNLLIKYEVKERYFYWAFLFFAVNPVNLSNIFWIPGRADLLAGFFVLLSALSCLKYIYTQRKIFLFIFIASFLSALSSKEVGMIIWFYLVLIIVIMPNKLRSKEIRIVFLSLVIMTGLYLFLRYSIFSGNLFVSKYIIEGRPHSFNYLVMGPVFTLFIPFDFRDLHFLYFNNTILGKLLVSAIVWTILISIYLFFRLRDRSIKVKILASLFIAYCSLIIYINYAYAIRLMYSHLPLWIPAFILLFNQQEKSDKILRKVFLMGIVLVIIAGNFSMFNGFSKVKTVYTKVFNILPDKKEFSEQKKYFYLTNISSVGQNWVMIPINSMTYYKIHSNLDNSISNISDICYYEANSFGSMNLYSLKQSHDGLILSSSEPLNGFLKIPEKRFISLDDSVYYEKEKIIVKPLEFIKHKPGMASRVLIKFGQGFDFKNSEFIYSVGQKFYRSDYQTMIKHFSDKLLN